MKLEEIAEKIGCDLKIDCTLTGETFFASARMGDYNPVNFFTENSYSNERGLGLAHSSKDEATAIADARKDLAERISGKPLVKMLCGEVLFTCPTIVTP